MVTSKQPDSDVDTRIVDDQQSQSLEGAGVRKVFLVDNPVSGTTDSFVRRETFLQHFEDHGWTTEVYETKADEDLGQAVRRAVKRGFDLVVASGGDGTVAAVASGLINANVPMGVIPAGTGNILARDLAIPLRFDRALEILTGDHDVISMDAMEANKKYYLLNLGVGLSSKVMEHTDRERKRRFGMLAYAWSVIVQLGGFKLRNYTLEVDGRTFQQRASEIMLVNSSIIGVQKLAPTMKISPSDGKLDVCIFRASTLFDLATVAVSILLGRARASKLRCLQASKRVVIRSDKPRTIQADGEIIGKTPLEVNFLPGSLQVIVPKKPTG